MLDRAQTLLYFLCVDLGACEDEIFGVLHLDSRHRLIAAQNLFRGGIASASVHLARSRQVGADA